MERICAGTVDLSKLRIKMSNGDLLKLDAFCQLNRMDLQTIDKKPSLLWSIFAKVPTQRSLITWITVGHQDTSTYPYKASILHITSKGWVLGRPGMRSYTIRTSTDTKEFIRGAVNLCIYTASKWVTK